MKRRYFLIIICVTAAVGVALACTSAIVPGRMSRSGRPIIWKHRDTGADNNFLARVEPAEASDLAYVGLFNGGDSLLSEAWMGMNEAGFAIMNTASYNLAPDTARLKDREGSVMALALRQCRSVADFQHMLDTLPRPMGVQANFGVADGLGNAAYFETSDHAYTRYDVTDTIVVRTNYSFSGSHDGELAGYVRYNTAVKLLDDSISSSADGRIDESTLTEGLSRSYYHSALGRDCADDSVVVNLDFIPRDISTASIAIVCPAPGAPGSDIYLWGGVGYQPTFVSSYVTLTDIPAEMGPGQSGWRSLASDRARQAMLQCLPYGGATAAKYIDLSRVRVINDSCKAESMKKFDRGL